MFCGEHGTLDYCPECLSEERDGVLEKRVKELESLACELHEQVYDNPYLDSLFEKTMEGISQ